jgi:hypothetical protein
LSKALTKKGAVYETLNHDNFSMKIIKVVKYCHDHIFFMLNALTTSLPVANQNCLFYRSCLSCLLTMSDELITNHYQQALNQNEHICAWFDDHKERLQHHLDSDCKHYIEIIGSRRWKLMHPLSDLDCAIVVQDSIAANSFNCFERLSQKVIEFYTAQVGSGAVSRTQTKARDPVVRILNPLQAINDNNNKNSENQLLSLSKLEYVLRTHSAQQFVLQTMEKALAQHFDSLAKRARYSYELYLALQNQDKVQELRLKQWYKVLNEAQGIAASDNQTVKLNSSPRTIETHTQTENTQHSTTNT